jgi:hypothetical protein
VYVSFIVGGYKIGSRLVPSLQLDDTILMFIGIAFFVLMFLFYLFVLYYTSLAKKTVYGHKRFNPDQKASVPL